MNREARREALDPLDLYDVAGSLSEEERMVRDSAHDYAQERLMPRVLSQGPRSG